MEASDIWICLELALENVDACEVESADEVKEWVGFGWDGAHLSQTSCEESLQWHGYLLLF